MGPRVFLLTLIVSHLSKTDIYTIDSCHASFFLKLIATIRIVKVFIVDIGLNYNDNKSLCIYSEKI